MPAPGEKHAESAEDWLIKDAGEPQGDLEPDGTAEEFAPEKAQPGAQPIPAESIGAETAQWLVPGSANGAPTQTEDAPAAETAAPQPPETAKEEKAAPAKAGKATTTAKRGDSKRLQKAKQALAEQREANADLAKRLRELQTDLRVQAKQAKSELAKALKERDAATRRIRELEAALAKAQERPPEQKAPAARRRTTKSTRTKRPSAKNGELELNEAKFEDLRELGLSVTQSARLIAYRDVRGGYDSLDELEHIPGLSKETLAALRARLTLAS